MINRLIQPIIVVIGVINEFFRVLNHEHLLTGLFSNGTHGGESSSSKGIEPEKYLHNNHSLFFGNHNK